MGAVLRILLLFVSCLLLFSIQPVASEVIIDLSKCDSFAEKCGRPGAPVTQKYCCSTNDGGLPRYTCCNPYFKLIVGLCVGVPAVILIIVGVVVVYCCCARYQSRKMQRLELAYRRRSRRARRDQQGDTTYLAPPPYTSSSTDNKTEDSELPGYSATDPYATVTSSLPAEPATPTTPDTDDQRGGVDNQEEGNSNGDHEGREMTEMENRPLLSEDEQS